MHTIYINTLTAHKADCILITNPISIRYLTGFYGVSQTEIESLFIITKKNRYLIVPHMYRDNAETNISQKNIHLIVDEKKEGLLSIAFRLIPKHPTVLFEEQHLPTGIYLHIQKKWNATMIPGKGIIEKMRIIKSAQELHQIQYAAHLTDQTINAFIQYVSNIKKYTSVTEIELAHKIRTIAINLGGEGMGFDPIVAGGKNSSLPHHIPNQSPLPAHGPLLVDIGVSYHGYTGDLTRTFYIGKPSSSFVNHYIRVLECNQRCIDACREGISTSDVQNKAMSFFHQYGIDGYFTHAIGHGVGLNIHEDPHFPQKNGVILKRNMVITIEPGIYLPGRYGIRIEDLAVIDKNNVRVFSSDRYKKLHILTPHLS